MDVLEYSRIVLDRIQKFEPEHAAKIVGYLLVHGHDMVNLASCEDHLIREVAFKAKAELQVFAPKPSINPISIPVSPQQGFSHLSARTPTSPASLQVPSPIWDSPSPSNTSSDFIGYMDFIAEFQKQPQMLGLENHLDHVNVGSAAIGNDYYGIDSATGNLNGKPGRRFSSPSEFPAKTCHYFNKGFCKHGSSCRYHHGQVMPESSSQMYGKDAWNDEQIFLPGSLAQLETEIIELLKPRRGNPISIASLPMAYYDKYKKVLQADGYLTESQRHGKSGYSLTKLLARLKNSIRLIDRPHGQHAVVLAEDAPKYMEKGDPGQSISASRQIYLTFPAESTFTEEDVSNYFNNFGFVEDVRIPCQQKRMFGFVTFADPLTVKTILEKGNPHFVRGSRVLVKPYRERSKLVDRKYSDRIEPHPGCYSPHYVDMDSELPSIPRPCGNPRFLRRQFMEEQGQALEFQRRRLAELQIAQKSLGSSRHFGFSMDGSKVSEDYFNFQPAERFSYGPSDKSRYIDTSYNDEESQGLNLPDSPFAFPLENGISAVI